MDFLLIAFLTLLNGVFAMSEMALASSRKARLVAMAESGDNGAQAALGLLEQPTQFLSSVQVGITSIGMLNGIIGEAAFSAGLSGWIEQLGMPLRAAELSATAIVVASITYVTIVFGELVPKRIGQLYPEAVARLIARPMVGVAVAAKPFVKLLTFSTQGVLQLLRVNTSAGRGVLPSPPFLKCSANAGTIRAALPSSAIDTAFFSAVYFAMRASASSRSLACSST